jgi:hypothetical protein
VHQAAAWGGGQWGERGAELGARGWRQGACLRLSRLHPVAGQPDDRSGGNGGQGGGDALCCQCCDVCGCWQAVSDRARCSAPARRPRHLAQRT